MTFPVIYAEIEFGKGPFDGDTGTVTVDVPLLKKVTTRSGRTNELEATPAGSAELTLDNADRRYDPFDTSGPWFGELLPNRKVTIYMTHAGGDRILWSGFTEDWPQSYSPPETADVILPCVDALGVAARATLPLSVWCMTIDDNDPLGWYRLDETLGYVLYDHSGHNYHGGFGTGGVGIGYTNGISESCKGLLTGDQNAGMDFHPSIHIGVIDWPILQARDSGGSPWERTYEFWWKGDVLQDSVTGGIGVQHKISEFRLLSTGTGLYPQNDSIEILYDDFTGLSFRCRDGVEQSVSLDDYNPRSRHHVVCYHPASDASADLVIYMDGAPATTTTYSRTPKPGPSSGANPFEQGTQFGANSLQLSDNLEAIDFSIPTAVMIDEVCVWDREVDATEVFEHYAAGANAWAGDYPIKGRLNNILAAAKLTGFQSSATTIPTHELGPCVMADMDPLTYLQQLEATESGRLVCRPDGIDLLPREEYPDPLSVAAAFTDDPAGTLHYDDVEFDTGNTLLRNKITIHYLPGEDLHEAPAPVAVAGQVTVTDPASILKYGPRPWDITTVVPNHPQARNIGLDLLHRHADPTPRVTKLVINPAGDSRLIDVASTLKLGDRVTVTRHPQGLGSSFTMTCHIDGIEHEIDNGVDVWKVTYYMSAVATV